MRTYGLSILMVCILPYASLSQIPLHINDFNGSSFGIIIDTSDNVITISPESDRNGLDIHHLQKLIIEYDIELIADGDVVFTNGLFSPTGQSNSLHVVSKENIFFSTASHAQSELDITLTAGKNIVINGAGISIGKGNISMAGTNVSIHSSGISINAGNIEICAYKEVSTSGAGIIINKGNLYIESENLTSEMGGMQLSNGQCTFVCRGAIISKGKGVTTSSLYGCGSVLEIDGDGLVTLGGAVQIEFSDTAYLFKGGVKTSGGIFQSSGGTFLVGGNDYVGGDGILTSGGNITMNQSGDVIIQARGIYSQKGNISIVAEGDIQVRRGGVTTIGGSIKVESIYGMITLDGMNLNTDVEENGVSASLDTSHVNPAKLHLLTEPVVGSGNIIIITQ